MFWCWTISPSESLLGCDQDNELQGGHVGNILGYPCNVGAKFKITEIVVRKMHKINYKFTGLYAGIRFADQIIRVGFI